MFNKLFSNRKPVQDPIADVFSDLNLNQKMSVFNFLYIIGLCDGDQGNREKELVVLNTFVEILGVGISSTEYFKQTGSEKMIEDLSSLTKFQKEFLSTMAWDLIICDGKPNQTEIVFTEAYFEKIGFSAEQFIATIEKSNLFMKKFG